MKVARRLMVAVTVAAAVLMVVRSVMAGLRSPGHQAPIEPGLVPAAADEGGTADTEELSRHVARNAGSAASGYSGTFTPAAFQRNAFQRGAFQTDEQLILERDTDD